ncbi:MAG: hypothetical protein US09_C0009G0034 [Candidatus Moranbacteria bacterium GW2011_GWD1_36_198]|nr:MAG: hypothetical protein US09_C0009G0034 [Candidatus Moranbacteria bacterium GW2011_GWD1_36_198]
MRYTGAMTKETQFQNAPLADRMYGDHQAAGKQLWLQLSPMKLRLNLLK